MTEMSIDEFFANEETRVLWNRFQGLVGQQVIRLRVEEEAGPYCPSSLCSLLSSEVSSTNRLVDVNASRTVSSQRNTNALCNFGMDEQPLCGLPYVARSMSPLLSLIVLSMQEMRPHQRCSDPCEAAMRLRESKKSLCGVYKKALVLESQLHQYLNPSLVTTLNRRAAKATFEAELICKMIDKLRKEARKAATHPERRKNVCNLTVKLKSLLCRQKCEWQCVGRLKETLTMAREMRGLLKFICQLSCLLEQSSEALRRLNENPPPYDYCDPYDATGRQDQLDAYCETAEEIEPPIRQAVPSQSEVTISLSLDFETDRGMNTECLTQEEEEVDYCQRSPPTRWKVRSRCSIDSCHSESEIEVSACCNDLDDSSSSRRSSRSSRRICGRSSSRPTSLCRRRNVQDIIPCTSKVSLRLCRKQCRSICQRPEPAPIKAARTRRTSSPPQLVPSMPKPSSVVARTEPQKVKHPSVTPTTRTHSPPRPSSPPPRSSSPPRRPPSPSRRPPSPPRRPPSPTRRPPSPASPPPHPPSPPRRPPSPSRRPPSPSRRPPSPPRRPPSPPRRPPSPPSSSESTAMEEPVEIVNEVPKRTRHQSEPRIAWKDVRESITKKDACQMTCPPERSSPPPKTCPDVKICKAICKPTSPPASLRCKSETPCPRTPASCNRSRKDTWRPRARTTGYSPSASKEYSPCASKGYSPSASKEYSRCVSKGYSPSASKGYSSSASKEYSSSASKGYLSSASKGYSSSASRTYMPSASRGKPVTYVCNADSGRYRDPVCCQRLSRVRSQALSNALTKGSLSGMPCSGQKSADRYSETLSRRWRVNESDKCSNSRVYSSSSGVSGCKFYMCARCNSSESSGSREPLLFSSEEGSQTDSQDSSLFGLWDDEECLRCTCKDNCKINDTCKRHMRDFPRYLMDNDFDDDLTSSTTTDSCMLPIDVTTSSPRSKSSSRSFGRMENKQPYMGDFEDTETEDLNQDLITQDELDHPDDFGVSSEEKSLDYENPAIEAEEMQSFVDDTEMSTRNQMSRSEPSKRSSRPSSELSRKSSRHSSDSSRKSSRPSSRSMPNSKRVSQKSARSGSQSMQISRQSTASEIEEDQSEDTSKQISLSESIRKGSRHSTPLASPSRQTSQGLTSSSRNSKHTSANSTQSDNISVVDSQESTETEEPRDKSKQPSPRHTSGFSVRPEQSRKTSRISGQSEVLADQTRYIGASTRKSSKQLSRGEEDNQEVRTRIRSLMDGDRVQEAIRQSLKQLPIASDNAPESLEEVSSDESGRSASRASGSSATKSQQSEASPRRESKRSLGRSMEHASEIMIEAGTEGSMRKSSGKALSEHASEDMIEAGTEGSMRKISGKALSVSRSQAQGSDAYVTCDMQRILRDCLEQALREIDATGTIQTLRQSIPCTAKTSPHKMSPRRDTTGSPRMSKASSQGMYSQPSPRRDTKEVIRNSLGLVLENMEAGIKSSQSRESGSPKRDSKLSATSLATIEQALKEIIDAQSAEVESPSESQYQETSPRQESKRSLRISEIRESTSKRDSKQTPSNVAETMSHSIYDETSAKRHSNEIETGGSSEDVEEHSPRRDSKQTRSTVADNAEQSEAVSRQSSKHSSLHTTEKGETSPRRDSKGRSFVTDTSAQNQYDDTFSRQGSKRSVHSSEASQMSPKRDSKARSIVRGTLSQSEHDDAFPKQGSKRSFHSPQVTGTSRRRDSAQTRSTVADTAMKNEVEDTVPPEGSKRSLHDYEEELPTQGSRPSTRTSETPGKSPRIDSRQTRSTVTEVVTQGDYDEELRPQASRRSATTSEITAASQRKDPRQTRSMSRESQDYDDDGQGSKRRLHSPEMTGTTRRRDSQVPRRGSGTAEAAFEDNMEDEIAQSQQYLANCLGERRSSMGGSISPSGHDSVCPCMMQHTSPSDTCGGSKRFWQSADTCSPRRTICPPRGRATSDFSSSSPGKYECLCTQRSAPETTCSRPCESFPSLPRQPSAPRSFTYEQSQPPNFLGAADCSSINRQAFAFSESRQTRSWKDYSNPCRMSPPPRPLSARSTEERPLSARMDASGNSPRASLPGSLKSATFRSSSSKPSSIIGDGRFISPVRSTLPLEQVPSHLSGVSGPHQPSIVPSHLSSVSGPHQPSIVPSHLSSVSGPHQPSIVPSHLSRASSPQQPSTIPSYLSKASSPQQPSTIPSYLSRASSPHQPSAVPSHLSRASSSHQPSTVPSHLSRASSPHQPSTVPSHLSRASSPHQPSFVESTTGPPSHVSSQPRPDGSVASSGQPDFDAPTSMTRPPLYTSGVSVDQSSTFNSTVHSQQSQVPFSAESPHVSSKQPSVVEPSLAHPPSTIQSVGVLSHKTEHSQSVSSVASVPASLPVVPSQQSPAQSIHEAVLSDSHAVSKTATEHYSPVPSLVPTVLTGPQSSIPPSTPQPWTADETTSMTGQPPYTRDISAGQSSVYADSLSGPLCFDASTSFGEQAQSTRDVSVGQSVISSDFLPPRPPGFDASTSMTGQPPYMRDMSVGKSTSTIPSLKESGSTTPASSIKNQVLPAFHPEPQTMSISVLHPEIYNLSSPTVSKQQRFIYPESIKGPSHSSSGSKPSIVQRLASGVSRKEAQSRQSSTTQHPDSEDATEDAAPEQVQQASWHSLDDRDGIDSKWWIYAPLIIFCILLAYYILCYFTTTAGCIGCRTPFPNFLFYLLNSAAHSIRLVHYTPAPA